MRLRRKVKLLVGGSCVGLIATLIPLVSPQPASAAIVDITYCVLASGNPAIVASPLYGPLISNDAYVACAGTANASFGIFSQLHLFWVQTSGNPVEVLPPTTKFSVNFAWFLGYWPCYPPWYTYRFFNTFYYAYVVAPAGWIPSSAWGYVASNASFLNCGGTGG